MRSDECCGSGGYREMLSICLTNSTLVYEPKCGGKGGGGGVSANEYSTVLLDFLKLNATINSYILRLRGILHADPKPSLSAFFTLLNSWLPRNREEVTKFLLFLNIYEWLRAEKGRSTSLRLGHRKRKWSRGSCTTWESLTKTTKRRPTFRFLHIIMKYF